MPKQRLSMCFLSSALFMSGTVLLQNQIVRVDIEGEYGRLSPGFISTLLNHINKRSMAYMDAVKKAERHYFLFCHQLTS